MLSSLIIRHAENENGAVNKCFAWYIVGLLGIIANESS